MTGAEKRNHRRFDLALPVQVRVQAKAAQWQETATNDISARGIYFRAQGDFEQGSILECEVTLPPELCNGLSMRVRCRGQVIRVERGHEDGSIGVAATIENYDFSAVV